MSSKPIFTIRRLRWLMVAGAVVLIGVLTGYIWLARHLRGGFKVKVPQGLGYDPITDEFLSRFERRPRAVRGAGFRGKSGTRTAT